MYQFRKTENACDLDLDPKTLVLKPDLEIMATCLQTKHEVNGSNGSNVTPHTETLKVYIISCL